MQTTASMDSRGMASSLPASRLLWLSDALLLAVAAVWGSSYGVMKTALTFYPVLGLLALRFGLTFLLLLPALRGLRGVPAGLRWQIVGLGALLLAIFLFESYGVLHTQAARAAFLISLCVVFTPLVEWALLRRRPAGREWAAVGLSLAGAALLAGDAGGGFGLGDGLVLGAALLRALMVCLTRRVLAPGSTGLAPPALAVTAVQSGVVALGCALLATQQGPWPALPSLSGEPLFWVCLAWLVGACTLFAFFAQNAGLQRSTPTRVALLMGSEPAFGALFAVALLGERVGPTAWAGGALIVAAALLATVRWMPGRRRALDAPAARS